MFIDKAAVDKLLLRVQKEAIFESSLCLAFQAQYLCEIETVSCREVPTNWFRGVSSHV